MAAAQGGAAAVPIEPPCEIATFRFASLVDAVGSDGRPVVSPERPRISDPDEKRKLIEYLTGATVLLSMAGLAEDMFDPARGGVVPANTLTDGHWIWADSMAYYLEHYDIGPEPAFYQSIREREYILPELNSARLMLASRALEQRHRIAGEMYEQWPREQNR